MDVLAILLGCLKIQKRLRDFSYRASSPRSGKLFLFLSRKKDEFAGALEKSEVFFMYFRRSRN